MSGIATAPPARTRTVDVGGLRALLRDSPIIPLIGLLVLLVVLFELLRPGFVSVNWAAVMVRTAIPLAVLAACQTLTMLTGGIDLSVAAIASMTGFLVATLVGSVGLPMAIVIALLCAALAGLVSGIGTGVFRVHPLIILFALHRSGYGRLLYAIGDNPIAARLSGVKSWQVLIVLYVISAVLAGIAGFLYSGKDNTASV